MRGPEILFLIRCRRALVCAAGLRRRASGRRDRANGLVIHRRMRYDGSGRWRFPARRSRTLNDRLLPRRRSGACRRSRHCRSRHHRLLELWQFGQRLVRPWHRRANCRSQPIRQQPIVRSAACRRSPCCDGSRQLFATTVVFVEIIPKCDPKLRLRRADQSLRRSQCRSRGRVCRWNAWCGCLSRGNCRQTSDGDSNQQQRGKPVRKTQTQSSPANVTLISKKPNHGSAPNSTRSRAADCDEVDQRTGEKYACNPSDLLIVLLSDWPSNCAIATPRSHSGPPTSGNGHGKLITSDCADFAACDAIANLAQIPNTDDRRSNDFPSAARDIHAASPPRGSNRL